MNEPRLIDDPRITSFGRLVEAHAVLTKKLNDELEAAVGLPLLWFGVLLLVGRSPNGLRPMHEVTNATAFTSGGVTRLVDRMERAGYVDRRPCPRDRRVTYIGLTERGREMLDRATDVHLRGLQEHLMDALEPEEIARLDPILDKLRHVGAGNP
ncbi:MAG TPA: MarR family winged helix-turn-helix transcriptional regulator [Chloroflexota bacterium]|nr:MarR family winged helix-turn-helix transcriptional regulator [Chloroflexota bacterium]